MYGTISNSIGKPSTGRGRTWRRELLAGSAFGGVSFSGGILALVLSAATPEPARAQCFTSQTTFAVSPENLACGNAFSSANSVHHGGLGDSGLSRSDRAYWYDVPIQAEIFQGPITGYGLEFRSPDTRAGATTGITVQLDSGSSITQSSVPEFCRRSQHRRAGDHRLGHPGDADRRRHHLDDRRRGGRRRRVGYQYRRRQCSGRHAWKPGEPGSQQRRVRPRRRHTPDRRQ